MLHGRQALTLSNGRMALSVLPGGGFIGAVHLTTGNPTADVNPMRVPVRPRPLADVTRARDSLLRLWPQRPPARGLPR